MEWRGASPRRWPLRAARRGVDGLAGRMGRGEPAEMGAEGRQTRSGRARRPAGTGEPAEMAAEGRQTRGGRARRPDGTV